MLTLCHPNACTHHVAASSTGCLPPLGRLCIFVTSSLYFCGNEAGVHEAGLVIVQTASGRVAVLCKVAVGGHVSGQLRPQVHTQAHTDQAAATTHASAQQLCGTLDGPQPTSKKFTASVFSSGISISWLCTRFSALLMTWFAACSSAFCAHETRQSRMCEKSTKHVTHENTVMCGQVHLLQQCAQVHPWYLVEQL
jgi:hypothetical protein